MSPTSSCACIFQTEGNYLVAEQAFAHDKGCCILIRLVYEDLVVPFIKRRAGVSSLNPIAALPLEKIDVFQIGFIEAVEVKTDSVLPVILWHHCHIHKPI